MVEEEIKRKSDKTEHFWLLAYHLLFIWGRKGGEKDFHETVLNSFRLQIFHVHIHIPGTGTVDSPDHTKITSSAYLFMAGKDPEIKPVSPSNNEPYDPIKLNIAMKEKESKNSPKNYDVI